MREQNVKAKRPWLQKYLIHHQPIINDRATNALVKLKQSFNFAETRENNLTQDEYLKST